MIDWNRELADLEDEACGTDEAYPEAERCLPLRWAIVLAVGLSLGLWAVLWGVVEALR